MVEQPFPALITHASQAEIDQWKQVRVVGVRRHLRTCGKRDGRVRCWWWCVSVCVRVSSRS